MSIFDPFPCYGIPAFDRNKYWIDMQRRIQSLRDGQMQWLESENRAIMQLREQGDVSKQWDGPRDVA